MEKRLLVLGAFAAILGCVADYLLLYHPSGNYHTGDYAFLSQIPLERIGKGHYLGLLAIPFEMLGLGVVLHSFKMKPWAQTLAYTILGFIMAVGVAYHGMIFFVARSLQTEGPSSLPLIKNYFEPFGLILGVVFVILTAFFIYGIIKNKSTLPKQVIYCNPAFIYLIIIAIYFLFPPLGNYLMVMGFNLSIALFFLGILILKK